MTNTKKSGVVRTIIFPEQKGYKAVCLDFDIIENASTRKKVEKQIKEAIEGYIINICKNNLSDKLLNRHADKKYWKIFNEYKKIAFNNSNPKIKFNDDIKKSSMFTIPIKEYAC